MTDKNPKSAESKAAKESQRKALIEKRNKQISDYRDAIYTLEDKVECNREATDDCNALIDHTSGFYDEIDKLTKGKALVGVTDMTVELANDIIRDAKKNIKGDAHLDRIKEFVPAGDNPVYPDILIVVRTVRQSLERQRQRLTNNLETLNTQIQTARTAIGALQYLLNNHKDPALDDRIVPGPDAIEPYVQGLIVRSCFTKYLDSKATYFDFDRLDRETVAEYLSMESDHNPQATDDDLTSVDEESDADEDIV